MNHTLLPESNKNQNSDAENSFGEELKQEENPNQIAKVIDVFPNLKETSETEAGV